VVAVIVFNAIDYSTVELSYKSIPLVLQDMLESFLNHLSLASLAAELRDSTTASNMKDEGKRGKLRRKAKGREEAEERNSTHPTPIHLHRELEHISFHLTSNLNFLTLITNLE